MDPKLSYVLKHKVTKLAPAIFTDNMMTLIMSGYNVDWSLVFTTEENYDYFFNNYGVDILLDIEDIVLPWLKDGIQFETDIPDPLMWHVNEETLSKFLYFCKAKFQQKSDEDAKNDFFLYCSTMIYLALDYYKRGITSALKIVFLEVYFFACSFLERMNFKYDLMLSFPEFS